MLINYFNATVMSPLLNISSLSELLNRGTVCLLSAYIETIKLISKHLLTVRINLTNLVLLSFIMLLLVCVRFMYLYSCFIYIHVRPMFYHYVNVTLLTISTINNINVFLCLHLPFPTQTADTYFCIFGWWGN